MFHCFGYKKYDSKGYPPGKRIIKVFYKSSRWMCWMLYYVGSGLTTNTQTQFSFELTYGRINPIFLGVAFTTLTM